VNTLYGVGAALLLVASQSAAQPGAALSERLPALEEVQAIRLEANFWARSIPPNQRHVTLTRQGTSWTFSGTAELMIGASWQGPERRATVAVGPAPPEVVRGFLDALASVPVREGRYLPNVTMDVFPDVTITLDFRDGGLLQLHTTEDALVPLWRVTLIRDGRLFAGVTDSEVVEHALAILHDYTAVAEFRALHRQ
jgi:hypothetical protein